MLNAIRQGLTWLGRLTTHPAAFAIVAAYAIVWAISSPDSFRWHHEITTLATLVMTILDDDHSD
jgi:hypothetical protein